jgi:hypothetical protein
MTARVLHTPINELMAMEWRDLLSWYAVAVEMLENRIR